MKTMTLYIKYVKIPWFKTYGKINSQFARNGKKLHNADRGKISL